MIILIPLFLYLILFTKNNFTVSGIEFHDLYQTVKKRLINHFRLISRFFISFKQEPAPNH